MIQTLSLAMSQHLSSLVPGFEGHYDYVLDMDTQEMKVYCVERLSANFKRICPAWQAEDVLRNIDKLFPVMERGNAAYWIADHLRGTSLDATYAYQKIEEYLWAILK